jgi:protocatechuate 3,4-dioxygenase beta subunit
VNTAFATQLAATLTDRYGNPIAGTTVTFIAPTSGASGTFAGGLNTATTNASGVAMAAVFTANTTAGAYAVTATAGSATTSPGFALTNLAGAPASITATSGTPQSATIDTAFAKRLVATVKDQYGNPIAGATVTFTAPASGASGTFAGGVNTAVTNAQGVATATVFMANTTAGSYTVTATAGTVTTNPGFALTNQAGAPGSIVATSGTPQTATVNTAFAKRLVATVTDSFGNPVSGATVTFNAPTSGASGTFAGGVNTAKTNAQGLAAAPIFTANGTVGSYTVTAKIGTLTTSPGFALTNN